MKTLYFLLFFFICSAQQAFTQHEDLTVLIKDVKNKPVKNHPVTLGQINPVTTKTDKFGMFTIPKANLHDTLHISLKNEGEFIHIPVNGYKFLKIDLFSDNYEAKYLNEANEEMAKIIARRQKMTYSSTLYKSDIEKSGCNDINCLLSRMQVRILSNGTVMIRGALTNNNVEQNRESGGSLIVVNGMPSNDASVLRSLTIHDIEEITVLKDANEYGVRGAEGAIVIKTRIK